MCFDAVLFNMALVGRSYCDVQPQLFMPLALCSRLPRREQERERCIQVCVLCVCVCVCVTVKWQLNRRKRCVCVCVCVCVRDR